MNSSAHSAITNMHIPFGINTVRETQVQPPLDRSRPTT